VWKCQHYFDIEGKRPGPRHCLSELTYFSHRLFPLVCHAHFAVHRRSDRETLLSLAAFPTAPIELTKAEVAMGDERAHASGLGERQYLTVMAFSSVPPVAEMSPLP
jgi:hypothetical protein